MTQNRIDKISEIGDSYGINVVGGENSTAIANVIVTDNELEIDVYEWTWVDYTEGTGAIVDRFGFATEHKIIFEYTNDGYILKSDIYDESDILGAKSSSYDEYTDSLTFDDNTVSDEDETLLSQQSIPLTTLQNERQIVTAAAPANYDVGKALDYADKWVGKMYATSPMMITSNYNPQYYYYSADCANFVSQCLRAGSISYNTGSGKLNTSSSQWWHDDRPTNTVITEDTTYTKSPPPWRHVQSFSNYWINQGVSSANATQSNMYPGNPVYFVRTDNTGHVWICVGYNASGTPIFNAHNRDVYHVPYSMLSADGGGTLKTLLFKTSNVTVGTPATATAINVPSIGGTMSYSTSLTAGTWKYYKVTITSTGDYTFYTTGSIDTYGYLYWPSFISNGKTLDMEELRRDDDSGSGSNFSISGSFSAGTFYIKVRGYSSTTSGSYTFCINRSK